MSIFTSTTRITRKYLMGETKHELAQMYLDLCDVNGKLNNSIMNQCGDNLCWIGDKDQAKALPEAEFMESCRRYRNQIASERGEFTGGKTIAQLEAEIAEHDASLDLRWKADMRAIKRWQEAHPGKELIWPDHADLCVWLLEQWESGKPINDAVNEALK